MGLKKNITFEDAITSEVEAFAKQFKVKLDNSFMAWFAVNVLDFSPEEALEAISVEGANDKGIDFFYVDSEKEQIIVGQAKYSKTLKSHPKQSAFGKLLNGLNWLSDPDSLEHEGRKELAEAGREYLEALDQGYGVAVFFVYAGPKEKNIEKDILVANKSLEDSAIKKFFHHYHLGIIRSSWEELRESNKRISEHEIKLSDNQLIKVKGDFGTAIVGTIPGVELKKLYEKFEDQLFDRNVRLYLGKRKGSVNEGILHTLNDEKDKGNFWPYNNGITFICDAVDEIEKGGETYLKIKNFNIINGCQTTVSISLSSFDLSEVEVLGRFIVTRAELIDNVIKFVNSQNPIKMWDITSQHPTQRRLRKDFEFLESPYFYLTRRGSTPKKDRAKYKGAKGKMRQIKADLLGQYAAAASGRPVLAWKHKSFIFEKYHDEIFPKDISVEKVLLFWITGEICAEIVKNEIAKNIAEDVFVLKKGGKMFVLAIMFEILKLRNGVTFLSNLAEEQITSKKASERLKRYAEFSKNSYVAAVKELQENSKQELTTLIKSEEFFGKVKAKVVKDYKNYSLSQTWLNEALPLIGQKPKGKKK